MPENTQLPLSIFTGQNHQFRMVSRSHGVIRPNLVDTFNFTPKLSNKEVAEFDNPINALNYTTFDGGSGKIGYMESNQGQLVAAMMDLDPTVAMQMWNAAQLVPFNAFGNLKGLDGQIKGSMLIYGCNTAGNPFDQALKEGAKRTLDFNCQNGIFFPGLAMQYTRARGATTQVTPPSSPVLATSTTGGFLNGGQTIYVRMTAVTAAGETIGSGEAAIHIPTGTNTNKVTVTVPAVAGTITAYNLYVSNLSNAERFSVQTALTSVDITALPSDTATNPPRFNTSGVFSVSNPADKAFSGAGPYTVTLDKAAYTLAQTGLDYAMVCKGGAIIATVDNPAVNGDFLFSADGTTFSVQTNPASEWFDLFTLYQP